MASAGMPFENSELIAHRRASVRPIQPAKGIRAFDAKESYHCASGDPSSWGAVPLLYAVKQILETVPQARTADDSEQVSQCLRTLLERGFDVNGILCQGFAKTLTTRIVNEILISTLPVDDEEEISADSNSSSADRIHPDWIALRDELFDLGGGVYIGDKKFVSGEGGKWAELVVFTFITFGPAVEGWIRRVEPSDVLGWRVPEVESLRVESEPVIDLRSKEAEWVVDRFTETYLRDWREDSLKLEWQLISGAARPPCPVEEMNYREVQSSEIAPILAEIAASPAERQSRNRQLVLPAVKLLCQDQRESAAMLFQPFLDKDWDDGELYNNYAFCKLPDAPEEALTALEHAVEVGDERSVNLANRILALYWLGRPAAALELAGGIIDRWTDFSVEACHLWDYSSDRKATKLQEFDCAKCYIVELGYFIACSTGEDLVAKTWEARVARYVPCHRR